MADSASANVPHGTIDYSELRALGLRPEELTHFSSNINPFGPPPPVVTALQDSLNADMIARYPDRLNWELRELLAAYHGLPVDSILVGNGSADLLWLVGLFFLQGHRVAILNPTFGEYRHIAQIVNADIVELCHPSWIANTEGFEPSSTTLNDMVTGLHQTRPDVIMLCNPNNPTGHYLAPEELERLYDAAPHALWIIDEAYAEFMHPPATTASWVKRGNWLVLRSMTKDFALGGLRLGYLLGAPALITLLQSAQSPWNVNTFAQLAGCIAMRDGASWRRETIGKLQELTATLQESMRAAGYHPFSTRVNYFLVPVQSAAEVRRRLLAKRLVVRDCTSFGLPHFIRIATQLPQANERLLASLREISREAAR
jgi:histidinol-phosphate aminotransferase